MFSRDLRRPLTRAALSVPALALVATGLISPAADSTGHVTDRVSPVARSVARAGFTTTVGASRYEMVGFEWQGSTPGTLELRTGNRRRWGTWTEVEGEPAEGPDAASREHHDRTTAGPVWVGRDVERVQVRVREGALRGLRIHSLRTSRPSSLPWRARPAASDPASPNVVSRAQWGADESWKTCAPEYAPSVRFAVLHHTVNANDYKPEDVPQILQGMYHFHTKVNGWCDIGYNALVDRYGRVWEGRFGGLDRPVIGAHAGGFNTGSVGVAMIGDFRREGVTDAMKYGTRLFLDWKLARHLIDPRSRPLVTPAAFDGSRFPAGIPVAIDAVTTHRDLDATACPGDALGSAVVERLRQDVQADILNSPPEPLTGWRPATGAPSLLVLDRLGGLHPAGSQSTVRHGAFWARWPIARGAVREGEGGYVLDGYGGVHPFGSASRVSMSAYWSGWDIARGIARGPSVASGWVLDGYGGLHPYGAAPPVANGPYWGWDIGRGVATNGARTGGYVLDGWGGVHPFGTAPRVNVTAYWNGWDIARAIAVRPDGRSGWVLDGWGGLHPFGGAPAMRGPYWQGWDIARGLVLTGDGNGGWVVDGWGGLHPFGNASAVAPSTTWTMLDVTAGVV